MINSRIKKLTEEKKHPIINGHIIHEIKDDMCILCFENEIKKEIQAEILQKIEKIDNNIKSKLQLLEDLLDDLKEKISDKVNISEHTGDMRDMINRLRYLDLKKDLLGDEDEKQ